MTANRDIRRQLIEFSVLGICTFMFALTALGIVLSALGKNAAGTTDFVEYWASGSQLAHRANPYNTDAILQLERSAGFPPHGPALIMWNPPYALLLVLPLGFLPPAVGNVLWLFLLIYSLAVSVRIVWSLHGRPEGNLQWLAYTFGPALACLLAGQIALLILLGLVLFLRWHPSRPFLAGVSLWLCMLKPHLFLPFGVVLVIWSIATGRYKILAGTATALAVSTGIVCLLDPAVWLQYAQMSSGASLGKTVPCLSILLRQSVSPSSVWLQYLPAVIGCVWAIRYFQKHRAAWDWLHHGSVLMLVSVLIAPYSWLMDQAVLIPALLQGLYLTRSRNLVAVLALATAAVEIETLGGLELGHSAFFLWTAPAWLLWYLIATSPRYAIAGKSHVTCITSEESATYSNPSVRVGF
jgi:hypothetical protein